jgi:hypothetical protein
MIVKMTGAWGRGLIFPCHKIFSLKQPSFHFALYCLSYNTFCVLCNAVLHNLNSFPGIISNIKSWRVRWAGRLECMVKNRNAHRVLVGKWEGKGPLGRPRHKWQYNIKMDLREIWWGGMDRMNMTWDRDQRRALLNTVIKISGSINYVGKVLSNWSTGCFPRRTQLHAVWYKPGGHAFDSWWGYWVFQST